MRRCRLYCHSNEDPWCQHQYWRPVCYKCIGWYYTRDHQTATFRDHVNLCRFQFVSIHFRYLCPWHFDQWIRPSRSNQVTLALLLPKKPRGSGACVNHLNRCKTSSGLVGILSTTVGSQILSVGIGCLVCRGTQHFTGTVSNEAASEMGYPAWPAGCTCNVIISISVFLSMATG